MRHRLLSSAVLALVLTSASAPAFADRTGDPGSRADAFTRSQYASEARVQYAIDAQQQFPPVSCDRGVLPYRPGSEHAQAACDRGFASHQRPNFAKEKSAAASSAVAAGKSAAP